MGKKRRILVAALGLAAVGGLTWEVFLRPEPEPVYQGKSLTAWLRQAQEPGPKSQEERQVLRDAVARIGTNAVPSLLRMLRARDSALTRKLVGLARRQHVITIPFEPAYKINDRTAFAFEVLGAQAKDAVPGLIKIYEHNYSGSSRYNTIYALGAIGPDAEAAVPLLLAEATETNTPDQQSLSRRAVAIYALGRIHAESQLAVPALAKALSSPD